MVGQNEGELTRLDKIQYRRARRWLPCAIIQHINKGANDSRLKERNRMSTLKDRRGFFWLCSKRSRKEDRETCEICGWSRSKATVSRQKCGIKMCVDCRRTCCKCERDICCVCTCPCLEEVKQQVEEHWKKKKSSRRPRT